MPLRVLVAPTGLKECLDATEVATAIADGIRAGVPDAAVRTMPLYDGGSGFCRGLVAMAGGRVERIKVTGPLGEAVDAHIGWLTGEPATAVVEVAAAAGLHLVPPRQRNPLSATSRGVGELISAALTGGAKRLLIGCGDSAINDGGAGMLQALGFRLCDAAGRDLEPGGGNLANLFRIETASGDPRLAAASIEACVNHRNILLGQNGVTRVFGPQKGARAADLARLDTGLMRLAGVIRAETGIDATAIPGGGASGGLGASLHAFLGARLTPRCDFLARRLPLDTAIGESDLVITAEGCIDRHSSDGKIPGELARRARALGKPLFVIAGAIGPGAEESLAAGVTAYFSMADRPRGRASSLRNARTLLAACSAQVLRTFAAGFDAQHAATAANEEKHRSCTARSNGQRSGSTSER